MTETQLQEQCNAYLRTRDIPFFHLAKGRANAQKRIRSGSLPDLVIWWKGRCILVELKTDTGKLNENQREFFPKLEAQGFPVHVVTSFDAFVEVMK